MKEKIELLRREILEMLPQYPIIVDQVGAALDVVENELDEGKLYRTLKDVKRIVEFTLKISEPMFFKTHFVVAAALISIPDILNREEFKQFDSASGAVRRVIEAVLVDEELTEKKGCFKAVTLNLLKILEGCKKSLTDESQGYMAIALNSVLGDMKEIVEGMKAAGETKPITPSDYITILGYITVIERMYLEREHLLAYTRDIINNIKIITNTEVSY